jgi:ketosteroid isomerase-like protein
MIAVMAIAVLCLSGCGKESNAARYEHALNLMAESKQDEAARVFDGLGDYDDAAQMANYCRALWAAQTGNYQTAVTGFSALGNYRECPMMAIYYTAMQYESQADEANWSNWVHAADQYDKIALFNDSRERAAACRQAVYDAAVHCAETKQYSQGVEMLGSLREFKDSALLKQYYYAFSLEQDNLFSEAAAVFKQLDRYKDSEEQAHLVYARGYAKADAEERAGRQEAAWRIFLNLGDYSDSFERACKPYYELGMKLREEGNLADAAAAFEHAGTYSDAETQAREARYLLGIDKREKENWEEAVEIFTALGDYKDSATVQIYETHYQEAIKLEESGDQEGAWKLFTGLGRYRDSFERACKPYYDLGIAKRDAGEWEAAADAFEHAGTYEDAKAQLKEARYQMALAREKDGDTEGARELFLSLGDYRDAAERVKEPLDGE